jgi:cytochrome c-type biogenesis protein CcmH
MSGHFRVPVGFIAGLFTGAVIAALAMHLTIGAHSHAGAESTSADCAPAAMPTPSVAAPRAASTGDLELRVSGHPDDASAWLALAEQRRGQNDYVGARAAYAKVAALEAMTAQSWADYAEVLSSLAGGSLEGEAGEAIDNALRLDAWDPKAMRLKATQAHEQHHDAEALLWWQRLRAVLPPDSPDLPSINAKIAEAASLADRAPPSPPTQLRR